MGFFKDERVDGIENELVVVKSNVVALNEDMERENGFLKDIVADLKLKNTDNETEIINLKYDVNTLKQHIEKLLAVLEKEEQEEKEEKVIKLEVDDMISDGWYSYKNLCKAANVGVHETALKYFLLEEGVLTKLINHDKNRFKINMAKLTTTPAYIEGLCKVHKDQIVFDQKMIQFVIDNVKKIKESYKVARRKAKEYTDTKNKLESINYENYREEIKRILNGDSCKYKVAYDTFAEKYTSFYDDWARCAKVNENNAKYKAYGLNKLEYICTFMNRGDYFLKVVCELYA